MPSFTLKSHLEVSLDLHNIWITFFYLLILLQTRNAEGVYDQVLQAFLKKADSDQRLKDYLEKANSYRYEIKQTKHSGNKCRMQAVWIGLER